MSADNQQESLDRNWIVGFTDGEGCFHVGINKVRRMALEYQVLPEFRVVQHEKDEKVLHQMQNFFGFGSIRINRKDKNGVRKEFRVRGLENLEKLTKFFKENPLKTSKQKSFEIFSEIIQLIINKEHLTKNGLSKIAMLASKMNRQVKSSYLKSRSI